MKGSSPGGQGSTGAQCAPGRLRPARRRYAGRGSRGITQHALDMLVEAAVPAAAGRVHRSTRQKRGMPDGQVILLTENERGQGSSGSSGSSGSGSGSGSRSGGLCWLSWLSWRYSNMGRAHMLCLRDKERVWWHLRKHLPRTFRWMLFPFHGSHLHDALNGSEFNDDSQASGISLNFFRCLAVFPVTVVIATSPPESSQAKPKHPVNGSKSHRHHLPKAGEHAPASDVASRRSRMLIARYDDCHSIPRETHAFRKNLPARRRPFTRLRRRSIARS